MKNIRATFAEWIGIITGLLTLYQFKSLNECPDIGQTLWLTMLLLIALVYFTTYTGFSRRIHKRYTQADYYNDDAENGIIWFQALASLPLTGALILFAPWKYIFDFLNSHFTYEIKIQIPDTPVETVHPFDSFIIQIAFFTAGWFFLLLFSAMASKKIYYASLREGDSK